MENAQAPETSLKAEDIRSHADMARFDPDLCVIKLGSAVVTTDIGHLDTTVMDEVARFVSARMERGKSTLLVSSGAVAAGIGRLGLDRRPNGLPELQAIAAVGQGQLMSQWGEAFARQGREVAQILVSADDFRDRRRYLNMRYTIEKLFEMGVVPIVNENDTITIEEIRFGDNDGLAQLMAIKLMADLLVFLTGVGGLYRSMPEAGHEPELIEIIESITSETLDIASGEKSRVGAGGMRSKLDAARQATRSGIPTLIASGKTPGALERAMSGGGGATLCLPEGGGSRRFSRRQRFIAFSDVCPRGRLWIDAGAVRALIEGKKSLLPAGVRRVEGEFDRQDVVEILGPEGEPIARGLTNFDARETALIQGRRTHEIEEILGSRDYDEVVHRDNLVVIE